MTRNLSMHLLMIVAMMSMVGLEGACAQQAESIDTGGVDALPDETPIAQVEDQVITGAQFRQRFVREIGPSRDALFPATKTVTLEYVAGLLVREKAVAIDARAQGLLDDPDISWNLERTRRSLLINHFVEKIMRPAVKVTDAQIDAQLKKTRKLTREQAARYAQNGLISARIPQLIKGLHTALHVQKQEGNMAAGAALYAKLLNRPEMTRAKTMPWVLKEQMLKELTPEQASLKLATFDGGAVTLLDVMKGVHGMVPVKRPKNLVTAKGVATVVDQSLGAALLEAHIKSLGLDKDPEVTQKIREREDQRLLALIVSRKAKSIVQPTEDEVKARFDEIKDQLEPDQQVKLKTVWCEDRQAAARARLALGQGRAFDTVSKDMGQDAQASKPTQTMASSETVFWSRIWPAEPNEVVGPIQGFSRGEVKWRVVKVLEKKEGKPVTPENQGPDGIQSALYQQRKAAILKPYQDELLKKYDHKIFESRLSAFNPIVSLSQE